ncbi:MAG TPA: hypothetical protein VGJ20_33015 [Xanthobacteraceae bacterium]
MLHSVGDHDLARHAIEACQCCGRRAVLAVYNGELAPCHRGNDDGTEVRPGESLGNAIDVSAAFAGDRSLV